MAWITNDDPRQFSRMPQEPDMNTLLYWVSRLEPIIRAESTEEVIVVFANRTGVEGEVTYAGTSAVIGIKSGEVRVYGILGRGDKELLVVDTDSAPYAKLLYRPRENGFEVQAADSEQYDHRQEYEINRGQRSQHQRGSETISPEQQWPGGESDATQGKGATAKYRRNDLSVQVHASSPSKRGSEMAHIHTPTAPSPTPQSLRPKLLVSTNHPDSHRFLNGPSPASLYATGTNRAPFQILGGGVRFHGSNAHAGISPLAPSESRFSESSYESSRLHWAPVQQSSAVQNSRWTPPDDADDLIVSDGSPITHNENRHSIRSDVSVWNNQPGRPPSISNQLLSHPTPPPETRHRRVRRDAPEREPPAHHVADVPTRESFQIRPSSPKSRHASRSRGLGRSNSAATGTNDLEDVCQRLEDMAMFTESTQSHRVTRDRSNSTSGYQASRSRSRSRKPTPRVQDRYYDRGAMTASIPIAFGLDIADPVDVRRSSGSGGQQRTNAATHDPPILRPASRSRIRQRSTSKGRIGDRPPSRNAFMQREIRSNTPANFVDRAVSRGRQREIRPATDQQLPTPGSHERRRSGNNSQEPPPDPVDLSQFTLIEEYPAPNCPVHGSRSRSGTGQRDPSGNRPATTNPTRPPAHRERVGRRSTQVTPRPASRKDTPEVATRSPNPPRDSPKPSLQTSKQTSKTPKPSTTTSTRSKLRNTVHKTSDVVETVVTSEQLDLKSPQGPKTPKAMVLVNDGKPDSRDISAALQYVKQSLGKPIDRPRSAIW